MEKIVKTGIIHVNGTNIKYILTNNYFDSDINKIAHCEFVSLTTGRKNVISSTGFKSHFLRVADMEFMSCLKEDHKSIIETLIRSFAEVNTVRIHTFKFGELTEIQDSVAIQQSLF
jgi:hypothetical protein